MGKLRNTRHTRKYLRVKKVPGNTRSHISTILPDPIPGILSNTRPDPTDIEKPYPLGTADELIFSTLCHYLSQCDVESDVAHFNEEMHHNASCCCYWCTTLVSNLDVMIVVVVNTLSMIIMITTITNIMVITSHHHPSDASFLSVTYSSSGWQKLAGFWRTQQMSSILSSSA